MPANSRSGGVQSRLLPCIHSVFSPHSLALTLVLTPLPRPSPTHPHTHTHTPTLTHPSIHTHTRQSTRLQARVACCGCLKISLQNQNVLPSSPPTTVCRVVLWCCTASQCAARSPTAARCCLRLRLARLGGSWMQLSWGARSGLPWSS